ncbi:MAG: Gfo/Idh/MocA family oxidoreductase [Verrucomicrobiales bacterium]|nr:Gfo/Idh/MocA family oxidoreductase [Verrucomicrobiales bacterium]
MNSKPNTSRRRFLAGAAGAIAAPAIIPSSVLGKNAPSNRVNMGFVGMGNRGRGVMTALMNHKKTQGIAVCDLHKSYLAPNNGNPQGLERGIELLNKANKKNGGSDTGVKGYADFREMIAGEDLDAIMVATPDHWHALVCMEAARKDIDIYCEKPITHYFAEGYHLHREVANRDLIFQVGSQQRSDKKFRQAVEIVRNGLIGKISKVEVGLPEGKKSPQGDTTIKQPPADLNYDMWCGPSEKLPYMEGRCHWNWRWHLNFGGGQLMDWIGHHNDIAHWGLDMDKSGPLSVEAQNFEYIDELTEIYNSPVNYDVVSRYPGDIEVKISSRNTMGTKWIGENGWVYVTRGKLEASNPEWAKEGFVAGDWKAYHPGAGHQSNFIEGVLNRKECICPAETGHRSATPGHLAYLSHKLGRPVKWDPKEEQAVGDEDAQKMLMDLPYRGDWKLV